MDKQYKVGVVGATGMVGQRFVTLLENHPWFKLTTLAASGRSAGKTYEDAVGSRWAMTTPMPESVKKMVVLDASKVEEVASQVDFIFCAVNMPKAEIKALEEAYAKAECPGVSNNSANRFTPDVPMVVPEINADDIKWHHGLIANPNCATIIGLVPTWPLHQLAGVKRMIVSTYQAASGAGAPGMAELEAQLAALGRGEEIPEPRAFAAQLASNLIPQIGGVKEEGFTSEEMKLQNEGRKIMHLPELRVNCTCVRVPVLRSHSESITLEFERDITVEEARAALAAAPGGKLVDDMAAEDAHDRFPMPMDTSDQDLIWVGRVRRDISNLEAARGITFWCCGDQIRKGAATNAVQIAKMLCE